jgi:ribokinase
MNIRDIAKLANVSSSTVSKILNNKASDINQDTINRVLKIVKEYNYSPNANYKNNGKTFVIGILLKRIEYTNLLLSGVINILQNNGYSLMIFHSHNNPEIERKNILKISNHNIDALIWQPATKNIEENESILQNANIKTIIIDSDIENRETFCIDFERLGYLSCLELIKKDHKDIKCLLKHNSYRSEKVLKGFKNCLFDNQVPYKSDMIVYEDNITLPNIFNQSPSAIVSSHYMNTAKLYEYLEKMQLKIPRDLSIITLRNDIRGKSIYPIVSYIKIPYYEFGEYIAQIIVNICEQKSNENLNFHYDHDINSSATITHPKINKNSNVVVVGSINVDIYLHADNLPSKNETNVSVDTTMTLGGKGFNQTVGMKKFHKKPTLIGKIGRDNYSNFVYDNLDKYSIEPDCISVSNEVETGKAYINVASNGDSYISLTKGANYTLTSEDIYEHEHIFENSSYCLVQSEISMSAVYATLKLANFYGVKTIFKPSTIKSFDADYYKYIDFFIPNRDEAKRLSNKSGVEDVSNYFIEKGVKNLIITLDKDGCYFKNKNISKTYKAIKNTVVDTTGASDSFICGFCANMMENNNIDDSINYALNAAYFCVSRFGVIEAMIDKESLDHWMLNKNTD